MLPFNQKPTVQRTETERLHLKTAFSSLPSFRIHIHAYRSHNYHYNNRARIGAAPLEKPVLDASCLKIVQSSTEDAA
jgi:hypothetical protein